MASSMAACTRACSNSGRFFSIQPRICVLLLATRSRPSSGDMTDQSPVIWNTTSELAVTSAR
jgi:hypothetical protein